MGELRSHLGRHQAEPIDAGAAKRADWRAHGILVVSAHDDRPSWPARELVRRLGARPYGPREGKEGGCRG